MPDVRCMYDVINFTSFFIGYCLSPWFQIFDFCTWQYKHAHVYTYNMDTKYSVFLFVEIIDCIYAQGRCGG